MPELHVYLADGFQGDRVVVRADGREVFAKESVTTQALTALADEFTVPVPDGSIRLEVEIPARGATLRLDLDLREGRYLALSLQNGHLTSFLSKTPLGFG